MIDEPDAEEGALAHHLRVAEAASVTSETDAEPDRGEHEQQVDAQHRAARQQRRRVAALLGRLDRARPSVVLARSREEDLRQPEPLREHQPRRGRRGGGAEAALLDRHRDHDRPLGRRARRRRTRTGPAWPPGPPCRSCRRRAREVAEDRVRGAADGLWAAPCRPCMISGWSAGGDVDVVGGRRGQLLRGLAGRREDLLGDLRLPDRAAVDDRRVGDRHLRGARLEEALAGREQDVLADRPRRVEVALRAGGDRERGRARRPASGAVPGAVLRRRTAVFSLAITARSGTRPGDAAAGEVDPGRAAEARARAPRPGSRARCRCCRSPPRRRR